MVVSADLPSPKGSVLTAGPSYPRGLLWTMASEEFHKFYPQCRGLDSGTLDAHAGRPKTVASRGFPRLPLYFAAETLASAKVVPTDCRCRLVPNQIFAFSSFGSDNAAVSILLGVSTRPHAQWTRQSEL